MKKKIRTMEDRKGARYSGDFQMPDGTHVRGELTLQEGQTLLELHALEPFDPRSESITGILYDRTRVSLIHCMTLGFGPGIRWDESYFSAAIFPHFVLFGDEHLTATDKRIISVYFVIDDATTLFYDYTSFGKILKAEDHIDSVVKANSDVRGYEGQPTIGPHPEIFYFTGKRDIFRVGTALGTLSASNNPSFTMPGPAGFTIKNRISVNIELADGISVVEATDRVITVLRFMEIMIGRPQNILDLRFFIEAAAERPILLDAYWSIPPKRFGTEDDRSPHRIDTLIYAADEPEYFAGVLRQWLERHTQWQEPRMRFASCFAGENRYDIDRLVGAANMFDILPASALPPETTLPDCLADARKKARELFRSLEKSPERDSVLGSLGRIGKHVLKRKVRHRAEIVQRLIGSKLPDLELVLDQAVDLRNHFVHGSDSDLPPENRMGFLGFFTDALQFVFAASDLTECGWNIERWSQQSTTMSHPFGSFRVNYAINLASLKGALPLENSN